MTQRAATEIAQQITENQATTAAGAIWGFARYEHSPKE